MNRTCSIQGCNRKHHARSVCAYHYNRLRDAGTSITYSRMHATFISERGLAPSRECVDCGKPAHDWSYDHSDPNELISATGARFSADTQRYAPRCKSCHRVFDAAVNTDRLLRLASELEQPIRNAIAERKRARRNGSAQDYAFWDERLEELMAPLKSAHLA